MKRKYLAAFAALALCVGCAETREFLGSVPAPGQDDTGTPEGNALGWAEFLLGLPFADMAVGAVPFGGVALAMARAGVKSARREKVLIQAVEAHGNDGLKRDIASRADAANVSKSLQKKVHRHTRGKTKKKAKAGVISTLKSKLTKKKKATKKRPAKKKAAKKKSTRRRR